MWNKRKQLIALTAVAALLVVPTIGAVAQSISPFGKGNSIESLSQQLDSLESRVSKFERNSAPTSLSGLYTGSSIGYCTEARPTFNAAVATRVYMFTTSGTTRYYPDGTTVNMGTTVFQIAPTGAGVTGIAQECPVTYQMTHPADGTFTWIRSDCVLTNNASFRGHVELKGRIFDGGRTLTLVPTTPYTETSFDPSGNAIAERICSRTNTLRKISD